MRRSLQPLVLRLSKHVLRVVEGHVFAFITAASLLAAAPAHALDIKLWPLIDYQRDAAGARALHLLGPVFSYETTPETFDLTLRPLFWIHRGPGDFRNQATFLYPLYVSRWDTQRAEHRVFALMSFRSDNAPPPDEWDRRFTIFPFVFYRYSHIRGTWLSVLPFYANVPDFLGYERIQMLLLPLYLHLKEPLVERTWLPFPFVSWTGGRLGRGYRIFPFYGWDEEGEAERSEYILWPFYVRRERHFTRPERERHLILFNYASIDSPTKHSRWYFGPFLTHTVDQKDGTDTWGFPWPFWVSQRDLATGERKGLRLSPFYENTHFGTLHSHFILWPVYRWETQEIDAYRHTRSDAFLVLYRNIEQTQAERRHRRVLRTLFPLYRASEQDGDSEFSAPATFDALLPRNPTIQHLYAPLWQLYTRRQAADQPRRWSVLWDLVSSDGTRVRYPIRLNLSE